METEERFIGTENLVQHSTAAPEDVLCTPADNWQFKRVSSSSVFPIGPGGYQIFQGIIYYRQEPRSTFYQNTVHS